MLSEELLAILRCPKTRQPVRRATPDELVRAKLTEGLTTQDGRIVYPIRNDIPMMMSEEGRALP